VFEEETETLKGFLTFAGTGAAELDRPGKRGRVRKFGEREGRAGDALEDSRVPPANVLHRRVPARKRRGKAELAEVGE
jgi:hypothetical protein